MPDGPPPIVLGAEDAAAPWSADLQERAANARAFAEKALGVPIEGSVRVVTYETREAFERGAGFRPTDIAAAAIPTRAEIAVVRPVWRSSSPEERQRTLIHEMVHLAIGRAAPADPPAWLDEGLAMIVAGESGFDNRLRLSIAGAFGALIPLAELENGVMMGGERQALAYAESHAATEFLLLRSYGGARNMNAAIREIAAELCDPARGRALDAELRDPFFRGALERQWIGDHSALWAWISFLTGTGFLWMATSFLFLIAYWRKRRMTRAIRERFEAEEGPDDRGEEWNEPWLAEASEDDEDP